MDDEAGKKRRSPGDAITLDGVLPAPERPPKLNELPADPGATDEKETALELSPKKSGEDAVAAMTTLLEEKGAAELIALASASAASEPTRTAMRITLPRKTHARPIPQVRGSQASRARPWSFHEGLMTLGLRMYVYG
jgi:hypothetical protein